MGLRYSVDAPTTPGLRRRADIVFRAQRIAVFIDGCFWHGCPQHGTMPKANRAFWQHKLGENRRRDRDTDRRLRASGWLPVRVWEHEEPDLAATRLASVVRERRHGWSA